MSDLKCSGVVKEPFGGPSLTVMLSRPPTDNEIRKIHDAVRSALNPPEPEKAKPGKIIRLHDGQPQPEPGVPSQGLIGALTQTLELAQNGRLQSLWGTGFTSDGMRFVVKGGRHDNVYEMAGALVFLSDEYRDTACETNKD